MAQMKADDKARKPNPLNLRDLTDASLRFLANASNETLGACAVGLCASTYLVLGRVGLILIGVVGGIVLHTTWESQNGNNLNGESEGSRRRRELGAEVARRALEWRDGSKRAQAGQLGDTEQAGLTAARETLDYSDYQPATGAALGGFTDAVIRDYVGWWYGPIIPNEASFPTACRQTLTSFIVSISNHFARKRTADPFLDFLANSTSIIIVFLNELSTALKASQRQEPEDAVRTYLQYQPESNLANVLSTDQQERKLQLVADDILQNFLDPKAYNFLPAKTFLQEVLAKLILGTTITKCAKPEWINGWIVYLLEDGEPELMNVIDAGVEDMGNAIEYTRARTTGNAVKSGHQRRVSKAEDAMQEALLEAKRMNAMIAEDEARRQRGAAIAEGDDAVSMAPTEVGMATPTSSDSDRNRMADSSMSSSLVFDIDGHPQQSPSPGKSLQFTSFDQLKLPAPQFHDESYSQPSTPPVTSPSLNPFLSNVSESSTIPSLTLHNAIITLFDDNDPTDRSNFKQKPTGDYLIQIEPASSRFPGWMISRKYADFEILHEKVRRIAVISGVPEFAQKYTVLPTWKAQSRMYLTQSLEAYIRFAACYEPLAESEAMKKFLDKEIGLEKAPARNKNVLDQGTAALENVGKGFINVLGQGGKGIAGGGKAVFGGVQGVLGAVTTGVAGQKRPPPGAMQSAQQPPRTNLPGAESYIARPSQDSLRPGMQADQYSRAPPLPARPSRISSEQARSRSPSRTRTALPPENLDLPPPPSEITGDWAPVKRVLPTAPPQPLPRTDTSRPATPTATKMAETIQTQPSAVEAAQIPKISKANAPVTDEETRICVELMFAIITELYSLSGAWTIRLSLLSAAKTFLLRPNNPQLDSIRALLQDSIIEANFSDVGLAAHINNLRGNTLPTEEELKAWPPEMSGVEKEKLRVKARRLLVERGMPQALTSVMGAAASGEALGRVFDCLQVEEVARGLVFALLLQALRAATQ